MLNYIHTEEVNAAVQGTSLLGETQLNLTFA
jgi:hypothetical protein